MIKIIRVYKRQLKIILFILITVLSSIFIGITLNSIVENVYLSIEIEDFKNKGVYQEDVSDSHTKYYKVSRETWMSDESVFQEVDGRVTYGNSGDIICTLDSYAGNLQITHDLVGFFFGGHCASVCYQETYNNVSYNKNYCIEAHYNNGVQQSYSGYWTRENVRDQIIVLRVKASQEKKVEAFHNLCDCIGSDYNKNYIFNTKNNYYCSDLISRAWQDVGIDLNYDGFYCSIQDIICSDMTYISMYKVSKNNVDYIYYLED